MKRFKTAQVYLETVKTKKTDEAIVYIFAATFWWLFFHFLLDHNISYVIHDFPLSNWSEARAICQKLDGDLASINNDEEDKLLSSMPNFSPSIDYWIGFNDIQQEGNFSWSDGSKFSYKKWASRQPDNANNEDCGTYKGNWGWNDLACHNKRRFICKMDSSKDMPLTITKGKY